MLQLYRLILFLYKYFSLDSCSPINSRKSSAGMTESLLQKVELEQDFISPKTGSNKIHPEDIQHIPDAQAEFVVGVIGGHGWHIHSIGQAPAPVG